MQMREDIQPVLQHEQFKRIRGVSNNERKGREEEMKGKRKERIKKSNKKRRQCRSIISNQLKKERRKGK